MITPEAVKIVRLSYNRCCDEEKFFETFYGSFLSQSEDIRHLFRKTDWPHQMRLIKKALHSAIIFAENNKVSIAKRHMEAIAHTHSHSHMDIKPEYYSIWLETMMQTIETFDPYFSTELNAAWREVLTFTIDFMISKYDSD